MKKNIVYVGMSADIIHSGHINIINKASKYGLVYVGLVTDKAISSYKRIPFMDFNERKKITSNIKGVHKVIKQETLDYSNNLNKLKPQYVVHGDDWKEGPQKKTRELVIKVLKKWGGELIEIPYTKNISSSKIHISIKDYFKLPLNNLWEYSNPCKIYFSINAIKNIGSYIDKKENLLIITSKSIVKNGFINKIKNSILTKNIIIFDNVSPNPTIEQIDQLKEKFGNKKIDKILAIGGGSVLDTGKILSLILLKKNNRNILHKIFRKNKKIILDNNIPVIAIPTTSGSGAEITPFATVWDKFTKQKYSLDSQKLYPSQIILDPKLTTTLSKANTLFTVLDAISHSLESLWNKNRSPLSETYALQSLTLIISSLNDVFVEPKNIKIRANLLQASCLAGMAISQTKTAIAHSISYPLTIHYGIPHGLATGFTLPKLLSDNLDFLSRNTSERYLFEYLIYLLKNLNLKNKILKYTTLYNILELKKEMSTKSRSKNYSAKNLDINNILLDSLN